MKKLLIVLLIAFNANSTEVKRTKQEYMELCSHVESLAKQTMEARQAGVPISKMLELEQAPFSKNMILAAFHYPISKAEADKKQAVDDFSNYFYLRCYMKFVEGNKVI